MAASRSARSSPIPEGDGMKQHPKRLSRTSMAGSNCKVVLQHHDRPPVEAGQQQVNQVRRSRRGHRGAPTPAPDPRVQGTSGSDASDTTTSNWTVRWAALRTSPEGPCEQGSVGGDPPVFDVRSTPGYQTPEGSANRQGGGGGEHSDFHGAVGQAEGGNPQRPPSGAEGSGDAGHDDPEPKADGKHRQNQQVNRKQNSADWARRWSHHCLRRSQPARPSRKTAAALWAASIRPLTPSCLGSASTAPERSIRWAGHGPRRRRAVWPSPPRSGAGERSRRTPERPATAWWAAAAAVRDDPRGARRCARHPARPPVRWGPSGPDPRRDSAARRSRPPGGAQGRRTRPVRHRSLGRAENQCGAARSMQAAMHSNGTARSLNCFSPSWSSRRRRKALVGVEVGPMARQVAELTQYRSTDTPRLAMPVHASTIRSTVAIVGSVARKAPFSARHSIRR